MPAATDTPPRKSHAKKTPIDHLQDAISDLDKARSTAQGDARSQLEQVTDRLRKLATDMRTRTEDEIHGLETAMDRAGETVRVEFGVRAIQAQTNVKALTKLADELRKRESELSE